MDSTIQPHHRREPIVLTREPDFELGWFTIRPSAREVVAGDAISQLEPRVMQVLVALAQPPGQVVSRDELIDRCWNGRIVGDDAITRCIGALRKWAQRRGNIFEIETLSKVGYRLNLTVQAGRLPEPPLALVRATPQPANTVANARSGSVALIPGYARVAAAALEPMLAVLPFDNLADDKELQFFSDGVSEEIMQRMVRGSSVKVIGRSSAFQFRGTDKAVPKVAAALNVSHVLDGAVRRSRSRIRISAQLIEVSSQTVLWSDHYDRDLAEAFELQDDIAGKVAAALNLSLTPMSNSHRKVDPLAYDLYMKARPIIADAVVTELHKVIPMLESAVSRAPYFAQAWSMLALARAVTLSQGSDALEDPGYAAARIAADRAIELDGDSPEALLARALLQPAFSAHAEKLMMVERASSAAPNDALARSWLGYANLSVGLERRARSNFVTASRLDPLSAQLRTWQVIDLSEQGREEDVVRELELLAGLPLRTPWYVHRVHWGLLLDRGQFSAAREVITAHADMMPEAIAYSTLRYVELLESQPAERIASFRRAFDPSRGRALSLESCFFAAQAGCVDAAFEALQNAFATGRNITGPIADARAGSVRAFTCQNVFYPHGRRGSSLRDDVRFPSLCARFGLVKYWSDTNQWPDCADEVPYDFKTECHKAMAAAKA